MRESYIEKTIELLIPTGDYQNIKIGAKIGETIEWSSAAERKKKIDAIREDLKRQVARDVNDILDSFELNAKANIKLKGESCDIDVEEDEEDFDI